MRKKEIFRKAISLLCSFNILLQLIFSFPIKGKIIFAQEASITPVQEITSAPEVQIEDKKIIDGLKEITNLIFERANNTPVLDPSPIQPPPLVITEIPSPIPVETIILPTQTSVPQETPVTVEPSVTETPTGTPIITPTPTLILIDPRNTNIPLPTTTLIPLPTEEITDIPTPQITLPVEKIIETITGISITPTPTIVVFEKTCLEGLTVQDSRIEDWEINNENKSAKTKEEVKLGVKYIFPLDNSVTVTFKCLPKDGSLRTPLSITQLKLSDLKLPEGTVTNGEYAYDITTGMKNGEFDYDITLPKTSDKKEVNVVYVDKSINEAINTLLSSDELKIVTENKTEESNLVRVENLNHLTIFFISGGKDTTNILFPVILDPTVSEINASDDIYYETKGYWPLYWFLDFQKNQYLQFDFSPNIPEGAVINNVKIIFEYQRGPFRLGSTQRDARMVVWNGIDFNTEIANYNDLSLSTYNQDETKIINVPLSLVNTSQKVNNFKFRFFMRGEGPLNDCDVPTGLKTKHDLITLDVDYTSPDETVTPTPTQTPSPTVTPTPIYTITPTQTPVPTETPIYSRIGDFVWNDTDDDNIQDIGELGISGVTVKAYEDDGDGVFEPSLDFLRATTTTNTNGNYFIDNLPAGTYFIYVDQNSLPEGGSGFDLSQGGSNPYKVNIAENEINLNVDFGFSPPAAILLSKSNDKPYAQVGEIVTYTLKIKTGERVLSSMTLIDNSPEGFIYQVGSSTVSGGTIVSIEPSLSNGNKTLTWNWSSVPSYGEVIVTYQIKIDQANQAASYTDYAWVKGKGSPRTVQSEIVDSTVIIGASYSFSTQAGENKVLGASTEGEVLGAILPAAGSETGYTVLAFGMIITGIILDNKKSKRRKK